MKKLAGLLMCCFLLAACGIRHTAAEVSPTRYRHLATDTLEAGYDTVFSCVLSELQSQGFLITGTDKVAGLVSAIKHRRADYSFWDDLLRDVHHKSDTLRASFLLRALTPVRTEANVTIYTGNEINGGDKESVLHTGKNNVMVDDPKIYRAWFDGLRRGILQRKGIIAIEPPEEMEKPVAMPLSGVNR